MIPTFKRAVTVYLEAVNVERMKCGKPCKGTVRNTMAGVRRFLKWVDEHRDTLQRDLKRVVPVCPDENDRQALLVSAVTPRMIRRYLSDLLKEGAKPVSAMSYVFQLRQLFAKWVQPYYEDHNWKMPTFPSLGTRPQAPRYNRPSPELLAKVKAWYASLEAQSTKHQALSTNTPAPSTKHQALSTTPTPLWFVSTMMLEFAMRNGDILKLKRENFVETADRVYLNYTPNKTSHSSGRVVKWPVHPLIWQRIRDNFPEEIDEGIFDELNRQMRSLGFNGHKGAYELRKICIDHVYQKYGAEMAVSISGDDIRTITHYYADPAQPNIGDTRIAELL